MAPNCNNTDIYVAVKEISRSLSHLRHEHSDSKTTISRMFDQILTQQRHMNRIDELIDQHQAKIDELMHMAVSLDQNPTQFQYVPPSEAHSPIVQLPLQVPVSDWSIDTMPVSDKTNWSIATADAHGSDSLDSNFRHNDQSAGMALPVVVPKSEHLEQSNAMVPFEFSVETTTSAMDRDVLNSMSETGHEKSEATTSENREESIMPASKKYRRKNSSKKQQTQQQQQQPQQPHKQQTQQQQQKRMRLKARGNLSLNSRIPAFDRQKLNSTVVKLSNTNQSLASFIAAARQFDTNGKIVGYYCCGHVFKMKAECERHVLSKHTDERPFKCNSCPFATARKGSLVRHHLNKHHHQHYRKKR